MLCPIDRDPADAEYVHVFVSFDCANVYGRTWRDMKDGKIIIQPSDLPRFLWADNKQNPEDLFEGFLKNDLLIKVSLLSSFAKLYNFFRFTWLSSAVARLQPAVEEALHVKVMH